MVESFERVFAVEFVSLQRFLRRRLGTAGEDLAAETFAVAYRNWPRFDQTRPARPWLYGIAANLMRHHWRQEQQMLRAYARTGLDPVINEADDAVARADANQLRRALAAALAQLPPRDRDLLLLHAWAELGDAEIADALSLPIGTVKSRLHRTKARLRNQLAADGQQIAVKATVNPEDAL